MEVVDTDDWLAEANQLFPETDESLPARYDLITEYYRNYPVPAGKSMSVIVATHAAFNLNLPKRFNAKGDDEAGLSYCASFQVLIKINPDGTREAPVVIEELNDSYITAKR